MKNFKMLLLLTIICTLIFSSLAVNTVFGETQESQNNIQTQDENSVQSEVKNITKEQEVPNETKETEICTVTFIDGNKKITVEVNAGETVIPPKPRKSGDVVWADEHGDKFDFSTPITENINLYAVYAMNRVDNILIITFDGRNGKPQIRQNAYAKDPIIRPEDPTKPGYIFLGWYTKDGVKWNFNDFPTGNMTLYAHWKKVEKDYSPQTGDDSDMFPWLLFMGAMAVMIPTTLIPAYRRKIEHRS